MNEYYELYAFHFVVVFKFGLESFTVLNQTFIDKYIYINDVNVFSLTTSHSQI